MTTLTAQARGITVGVASVLPETPDDFEKTSYAWRSLPFLTTALTFSSLCVIAAQLWFEMRNPLALPFIVYTGLFLVYQMVSLPVNFTGRSFDLEAHVRTVNSWRPLYLPTVDIFLPICGEPAEVLRNTWSGVFELIHAYPGSGSGLRPR